jgi:hypothetical protein
VDPCTDKEASSFDNARGKRKPLLCYFSTSVLAPLLATNLMLPPEVRA